MRKRGRKSHSETTNRTKEQRVEFQEEITAIFSLGKVKCAWKSVFHSEPWSLLFKAPEKSDNSLLRMPPVHEATNAKGRVSQTAFLTSLVCCPPLSLAYAILPSSQISESSSHSDSICKSPVCPHQPSGIPLCRADSCFMHRTKCSSSFSVF